MKHDEEKYTSTQDTEMESVLTRVPYTPMHVLPLTSTVIPGGHWQKKEPGVLMHFPLIQSPANT